MPLDQPGDWEQQPPPPRGKEDTTDSDKQRGAAGEAAAGNPEAAEAEEQKKVEKLQKEVALWNQLHQTVTLQNTATRRQLAKALKATVDDVVGNKAHNNARNNTNRPLSLLTDSGPGSDLHQLCSQRAQVATLRAELTEKQGKRRQLEISVERIEQQVMAEEKELEPVLTQQQRQLLLRSRQLEMTLAAADTTTGESNINTEPASGGGR